MSETPSIRISEHHQQQQPCSQRSPRHPTFSSAASAADPMAIPRAEDPAPPPLPPPSNIPELNVGQDPGWQWGQDSTDFGRPAAVRKGSSLLGAKPGRQDMDREHPPYDDARRASSISTITVNRDYEMQDGSLTPSDDGGRATANYRYVCVTWDHRRYIAGVYDELLDAIEWQYKGTLSCIKRDAFCQHPTTMLPLEVC